MGKKKIRKRIKSWDLIAKEIVDSGFKRSSRYFYRETLKNEFRILDREALIYLSSKSLSQGWEQNALEEWLLSFKGVSTLREAKFSIRLELASRVQRIENSLKALTRLRKEDCK